MREVVILPDNDMAGVDDERAVARGCLAAGLVVKLPRLPGLLSVRPKQGEDVSDWFDAGHPVQAFNALVAGAAVETAERLSERRPILPPSVMLALMLPLTHGIRDALGRGD